VINEELFTRLTADAGVSALVASRVYPHKTRFTPTYPHIVYEVTSDDDEYSMAGEIGLPEANIVYRCIAETYREARALAAAVKTSLSGFSGTLGSHRVRAIFVDGIRDDRIQKTDDPGSFYYVVNVVISAHYE
jgi:hypothetical protein